MTDSLKTVKDWIKYLKRQKAIISKNKLIFPTFYRNEEEKEIREKPEISIFIHIPYFL